MKTPLSILATLALTTAVTASAANLAEKPQGVYRMNDGFTESELIVRPLSNGKTFVSIESESRRGDGCAVKKTLSVKNGWARFEDTRGNRFAIAFSGQGAKVKRENDTGIADDFCGLSATVVGQYKHMGPLAARAVQAVDLLRSTLKAQSVEGVQPNGAACTIDSLSSPAGIRAWIYPADDLRHNGNFALTVAPAAGTVRTVRKTDTQVLVSVIDPEEATLRRSILLTLEAGKVKSVAILTFKPHPGRMPETVRSFKCAVR